MSLPLPFRRLAWSNLAAQSAEQMSLAAAPIIAVLALGAGPAETGMLATAQSLPFLLFSLPAGVLADRMRRLRLMVLAESVRVAALVALPLLLALHALTLPLLALIGAAISTGTVVFSVAAPALVPALVPRSEFGAANTRLELARSLAFTAGPGLAGAVVATLGGGAAFTLSAMLSAASVAFLIGIADPALPRGPARRVLADLAAGLHHVQSQPLLRAVMGVAVVWNFSWFVLQSVYVLYAVRMLGLDASLVGATLAAYGAGMVAGALAARRLMKLMRLGHFICAGPLASVLGIGLITAAQLFPGPVLPILGYILFGFGPIMWTIGQTTLRQAITPEHLLGRASALFMMASYGARPVGAALGGLLGEMFGLQAVIWIAVAGFVAQAVIVLASPIAPLRDLPDHAEIRTPSAPVGTSR